MTPVRMALSRLTGERLVEVFHNDGFHVPTLTEKALVDLYEVNAALLDHCLQRALAERLFDPQDAPSIKINIDKSPVLVVEEFFLAIATASGSEELALMIEGLNARLHLCRGLENAVEPDFGEILEPLLKHWVAGDLGQLREALADYHAGRIAAAPNVVKQLYVPRFR